MTTADAIPSPEAPLVGATHLSRAYDHGRVQALTDVSLSIGRSESVSIWGPSGSGKSTLLGLLCGLDYPTSGEVRVDGRVPASPREWADIRSRRFAMVFQAFNLLPMLTARENVEIPMFGVVAGAAERARRATALLTEVGLADRLGHRPHELSGGERQRVAIARSLANDPVLLLADEPTGSLDSESSTAILRLLFDLHQTRGLALVMVTHDPDLAARTGRQIVMRDGRITEG